MDWEMVPGLTSRSQRHGSRMWCFPSRRGWLQAAGGRCAPWETTWARCLLTLSTGPSVHWAPGSSGPTVTARGAGAAGARPRAYVARLRSAPNSSELRTPHVHITCLNKITGEP